MKKVYITGISGSGKTSIGKELERRGYCVLDIDLYNLGLCLWQDINTKEKVRAMGGGKEWLESHVWVCDKEKLKNLINEQKNEVVFVLGITSNQNEYLDLFDDVLLLQCSEETFLHRIEIRTDNNYGKKEFEKMQILGFYKEFEDNLIKRGASSINVEGSIQEVSDNILTKVLKV